MTEQSCTCPYTDPATWTTYGSAIDPATTQEYEPTCPVHGALRTEVEALRAVLVGRCLANITLRDEEHRQAVCILAEGHDTVHDDGMSTTWTDKDHWKPSGFDAANAEIERLQNVADAAEEQVEVLRATVARVEKVAGRMARHAEGDDPYWTTVGICGREVLDALRGDES